MSLWQVEFTEVLTFSQHCKRAHAACRLFKGKNGSNLSKKSEFKTYREAFAYFMSRSMQCNYCLENLGGNA